ncbi:putative fatty acyl-CoA reductase CG5065 [Diachasma alloeum]|uniref:putative fatty acyl-CoA reductase CG5065 n=1 Tax=Diachasma alloeum TaxID=454923 RepID=UPI0007383092|nr:putative fatty acyl-CoA reductase CG5065 [Diachasma alloeum]
MSVDMRSVCDIYQSKSVLITGSTGSLGKILVEKLLRCCPGIVHIYLLVRPIHQSSTSASQRLSNFLKSPLFNKLRNDDAHVFNKIVLVEGDLKLPNIGISASDRISLMNNVSVVFHCAADMKFDAELKDITSVNVFGTRRLLQLCKQMKKLEAFVYVSTLYSTCHNAVIEECVPLIPPFNGIADWNERDEDEVVHLTPQELLDQWPNTYTFSKAVTEIMLDGYKHLIPISIVRPSIILSTLREPMPGWIDNYYGPTLMICNSSLGLKRSLHGYLQGVANFIPTDLVVNVIICAAWKTVQQNSPVMKIYNCCTGKRNPITWGQFGKECLKNSKKYACKNMLRYPHTTYSTSRFVHRIISATQEYLVVYIHAMTNGNFKLVRIQKRLTRLWELVSFFSNREWIIDDNNVVELNDQLSQMDKKIFCIDMGIIDWPTYLENYVKGIRVHLLKDSMDSIKEGRARLNVLYWKEILIQLFLVAFITASVYVISLIMFL